jgi:RNA polymerase sigma-70 factor (ECF subfamily)
MPNASTPITALLREWRGGNGAALDRLTPVVYDELRRIARGYMRNERGGHTLQPTAVVHEAYLRLVDADVAWHDRVHFFAVAARLMRRILVDHAKARGRAKRGGALTPATLDEAVLVSPQRSSDLLALDAVLDALAVQDARKAQIVELHFFGGLTYDELAEAVAVSAATIHRELRLAKAWLQRELTHRSA